MNFEEAYLTIVKASKQKDTIEIPTITESLDFSRKNCLEIGCGPLARLAIRITQESNPIHITGIDIFNETIKKAKKEIKAKKLDNKISVHYVPLEKNRYSIPYRDNEFDIVYGSWLPHSLVTREDFLTEIDRVSKKNILLLMPGIDDDLVTMKSLVFPKEKNKRESYKEKITQSLKNKGYSVRYKEADLQLDFKDVDEIKEVFYCFDFKNELNFKNKEKVDNFLESHVHSMKNSFYIIIGDK